MRQALDDGVSAVAAGAEGYGAAAVSAVSEKCCSVLKQLRAISTTYRMVNRPLPTRPSHYVAAVLVPLRCDSAFKNYTGNPIEKDTIERDMGKKSHIMALP